MSVRISFSIGAIALLFSSGIHALDLKEALERAEQYDATLRGALADYMSAEELYPQSRASLLPEVRAGGFIRPRKFNRRYWQR